MIKGNLNNNLYEKIEKLAKSRLESDGQLAKELLIGLMFELTPPQWYALDSILFRNSAVMIDASDIQKFWYDKRKKEGESNERVNSEESK